jgi:hypothetical protein
MDGWMPELTVAESGGGRCRLTLAGVTYGNGRTLQEAADDLVDRLVTMALALRRGGLATSGSLPLPDTRVLGFLHDVASRAGCDDDLRQHVLRGVLT